MQVIVKKLPFYRRPEDIFHRFREEPMAVFLDSSLENDLGRYSIIGLSPYLILQETEGKCTLNGEPQQRDILTLLKKHLKCIGEVSYSRLPLTAGAVGYFTYDYGRRFENISSRHSRRSHIPEALFCFYDNLIIGDLQEQTLYLAVCGQLENPDAAIARISAGIQAAAPLVPLHRHESRASFQADFTKQEYQKAIREMISYMKEGHIYVANMTQQLTVPSDKRPYDTFRYLRTYNPSPFGAYMNYGDFQVVSASPERFLHMKNNVITTRPIKGTRRRGDTLQEDMQMRMELENSQKDRSELLMIMDLERNDLNRICVPGSVKVTEPFVIEEYATVFHLVSGITGRLQAGMDAVDLMSNTFPGGSITGAPKIRAMEIIDELEHNRRELYTGSIGYFAADGACDFNIVIRTAVYENGQYRLGAGGGITYESDVEFEYEETLQKARAVLEAIYDKNKY